MTPFLTLLHAHDHLWRMRDFPLDVTDPLAPVIVDLWASLAELHNDGGLKVEEARACATSMREWRDVQLGKTAAANEAAKEPQ